MNSYQVIWSEEDQEYVGLCTEFPSLSWLQTDPLEALRGIIKMTMKKYAVAHVDFFENDLKIKIIEAGNWRSALKLTFSIEFNGTLEEAKEEAFNQNYLFDVVELP